MSDELTMFEIAHGMSNFDDSIDEGLEAALRAAPSKVYGIHSAWNFNGRVWYNGTSFVEEVWRHKAVVDTIRADTLTALRDAVNEKYGAE